MEPPVSLGNGNHFVELAGGIYIHLFRLISEAGADVKFLAGLENELKQVLFARRRRICSELHPGKPEDVSIQIHSYPPGRPNGKTYKNARFIRRKTVLCKCARIKG